MNTRKLVVAAAIVDDLERPTTLLVARRSRPQEIAGRWEFPGGKAEPAETPEEALHRELREELGVQVRLGSEITGPDDGGWIITDRHVMRLWFAVLTDGEPQPLIEHDLLEWTAFEDARGYDWLDGDVRIIEHMVGNHQLLGA